MKSEPVWPFNMILWAGVALCLFVLTGCQTASVTLDGAQALRGEIAKKELEVHIDGVCGSNFDVIRDKFGKSDQEWTAILTICGSNTNSTGR